MSGPAQDFLTQLVVGERGVVSGITGEHGALSRLSALGFSIGTEVQMLRNASHGPMIVLVRNTRVALAREVAAGILLEGACHGMP
ncbi:MAG: ferrous iron transport protein A [Chloroflexi bacterium]|nr:ferrous iron transport protein A [Chloroflexota bacterium]